MAEQLTRAMLHNAADIHADLPLARKAHVVDRSFALPAGLYKATVGLYLSFLALLGIGFAHPEMIIPVAIFALFIVAGFGLPTIWTRLAPASKTKAMTWAQFARDGIMTASGRATARDAMVQVLILPALIFVWGVAAVIIAASVS